MLNQQLLDRIASKRQPGVLRQGNPMDIGRVLELYCMKLVEEEHMTLTPDVVNNAATAITNLLTDPERTAILCEVGGILAGQLFFEVCDEPCSSGKYVYGYSIFVRPEYRGIGVPEQLIAAMIKFAQSIKATRFTFFHSAEPISKFYQRLGAEVSRVEYEVTLCPTV